MKRVDKRSIFGQIVVFGSSNEECFFHLYIEKGRAIIKRSGPNLLLYTVIEYNKK